MDSVLIQYSGDVGCFVVYLLNYIRLQRGQALFLGPNEPHAYLSGDMMECMAASDNTVRAGLTPKFKDVDTLCSMLTYATGRPKFVDIVVEGDKENRVETYAPPVDDFMVSCVVVNERFVLEGRDSASIFIVESGQGTVSEQSREPVSFGRGDVFLLTANRNLTITNNERDRPFILWVASVNCTNAASRL